MWIEPETVGGGVSMENTSPRSARRSKRWMPSASQRSDQTDSMPSSVGLSGTRPIGPGYAAAPATPSECVRSSECRSAGNPPPGTRMPFNTRMDPRLGGGSPVALPGVLRLYDTAAREVRELASRDAGKVSIYLCGPTVYAPPHLGHGRQNVIYDVLVRYLRWTGLEVRLVSNVTDIDDQIINRANAEGRAWRDITTRCEAVWFDAQARLGV